jgi:arylsulfatase A-like enzyme
VVTDDQRWDTLSALPTVQRELVGKGVTFRNAFVVNALCCPSRASILTGRYSHSTGVWVNTGVRGGFGAFDDASTIATWLDAAGYETALVGKYLNGYAAPYVPPGWDRWVAFSGAPEYYDYHLNVDGSVVSRGADEGDYSTDALASEAVSFIQESEGPLFLYFAPFAPHFDRRSPFSVTAATRHAGAFAGLEPWRPPSYDEADVSDKPAWLRALAPFSEERRAALDSYRRSQLDSLLAVDDAVAGILDALADTRRLRNTLFVFTSDNGLAWGEHRWSSKLVPYEESIRVPLVVRYDALPAWPRADDRIALNVDLAPTLAAAAGTDAPGVEGRSLLPLLSAETPHWRSDFLVEHLGASATATVPTYCAVRGERYAYVQYASGEEELYDLALDPHQLENRARRLTLRRTLSGFRSRLLALCRPAPPRFKPRSPCLLEGGSLGDVLRGTPYYDLACGRGGPDRIFGGGRADDLYGGLGEDQVTGGGGADRLFGGAGRDRLAGGPGNDRISAADGRADAIACGDGDDSVIADRGDVVGSACELVRRG